MEESEKLNEMCAAATASEPGREDELQEQIDAVAEAVSTVANALGAVTAALAAVVPEGEAASLAAHVQAIGDISQTLMAEEKE